ncbi:MAG: IclR family transcriptional regulator [Syntrophomonadaceae bacterium]|jgi:DNA-binding IclR family transcriptional regulator
MPDSGRTTSIDSAAAAAEDSKTVQSVERALSIIEAMAQYGIPMSLGELAARVDLKPSTVHRLLSTLMAKGFVNQDDNSRYKLSIKLFDIGNTATYAMDIKEIASPFMRELLDKCNETVNLAVLDQDEVVYIDQLESNNIVIVKMFARIGNRGPAYCTGSGKVLLAGLSPEDLNKYISHVNLQKFTSDTITDPAMLVKELARVRREGYALDLGERDEGVRCVAAPINNHEGQVMAALSVSGPSMRMTASYINNELTPLVKDMASRISEKMGYKPG